MKRAKQQSIKKKQHSDIIQHETKENLRLNKYISDTGYCSRREADRLIAAGKVTVDGKTAEVGLKVMLKQQVTVNGEAISLNKDKVYIALNKPVGITSTTDQAIPGNLTDFMNYPEMIFPIGRLDKDSTGLLLMTNDGDIVNKILREENGHDKEYLVTVNKPITPDFISKMQSGVTIYNPVANKHQKTKPCKVKKINEKTFRLTLQQGLNRQIRRMCTELGYKVEALKRERVMNVHLENLGDGQWRYLTDQELRELNASINK